ncbi:hypothetical protein EVC12_198 [Rhizobium phage RHph_I42]|nr:hypothetical protein EVC12_198 [Rhizobium phage RHph_I42]
MRKLLTTITAGWLLIFNSEVTPGRDAFTVITPDSNDTYATYEDCVAAGINGIKKAVRVDGTTGADNPPLQDTIILCVADGSVQSTLR